MVNVDAAKRAARSPGSITLATLAAAFLAISGVYSAAGSMGLTLPRPAWRAELIETERQFAGVIIPIADDAYLQAQQDRYKAQLAIDQIREAGGDIPDWLQQDLLEAQQDIRRWDEILRDLREQQERSR